jgi:soluble lytic murein transglycosylase-like protein
VRAGVRYLRRLLDAFGREEVALMAYNAGPNRILGYLREGEIPTRFHVYPRRVKAELRRLRRSTGAEPAVAVADAR